MILKFYEPSTAFKLFKEVCQEKLKCVSPEKITLHSHAVSVHWYQRERARCTAMKILSRSLLALLLLTSALPSAQAAVTMVSGNIYDVGKLTYSQDERLDFDGTYIGDVDDSPMCWAAAAANVIQ